MPFFHAYNSFIGLTFNVVFWQQGFHSLQVYRVAHALWHQGRKVLALALQSRVSEVAYYWTKLDKSNRHKWISYFCFCH